MLTTENSRKEENGIRREMQRTNCRFNRSDDFVDYRVSCFCQESFEQIKRAFNNFTNELGRILEEDRIMCEKRAAVPMEDRQV